MSYAKYFQARGHALVSMYRKYTYTKYTKNEVALYKAREVSKWDAYVYQATRDTNNAVTTVHVSPP